MNNSSKLLKPVLAFSLLSAAFMPYAISSNTTYADSLSVEASTPITNGVNNAWTDGTVNNEQLKEEADLSTWNIRYDDEAKTVLKSIKSNNISALKAQAQQEAEAKFLEEVQQFQSSTNANDQLNFAAAAEKTKAQYRSDFNLVALSLGSFSCPFAGQALKNSLQDSPSALDYAAGSSRSNAWSLTSAYTTVSIPIAKAIDNANAAGKTFVSGDSSVATSAGNAGLDFYLALGKVTVSWAAEKVSGSWKVYIHTYDKYDFQDKTVPSSFPNNIITIANNEGAKAQAAGAIVPYFIHIYTQQNYKL